MHRGQNWDATNMVANLERARSGGIERTGRCGTIISLGCRVSHEIRETNRTNRAKTAPWQRDDHNLWQVLLRIMPLDLRIQGHNYEQLLHEIMVLSLKNTGA